MADLDLSPAARADLVEIRKYSIEQFGSDIADPYFFRFEKAFAVLRTHPLSGQPQPTLGRDIRCYTHRKHRVFYRVEAELVLIVRIIDHARNTRRELIK